MSRYSSGEKVKVTIDLEEFQRLTMASKIVESIERGDYLTIDEWNEVDEDVTNTENQDD